MKLKLAPIWLNLWLKISTIFFSFPHPIRHGRITPGDEEIVTEGERGNSNCLVSFSEPYLCGNTVKQKHSHCLTHFLLQLSKSLPTLWVWDKQTYRGYVMLRKTWIWRYNFLCMLSFFPICNQRVKNSKCTDGFVSIFKRQNTPS